VVDNANLATVLRSGYKRALTHPFLAVPHQHTLTYADVERRTDAFCGALSSQGVGPGDRVIVKVQKSCDAVALYLACLRVGAVYVPLNAAFTDSELDFFIEDAEPMLLVNEPTDEPHGTVNTLNLDSSGGGTLSQAASVTEPTGETVIRTGDDIAAMLYTSGTTGRPKGAMLTHRGLAGNARALHSTWEFDANDVLLHALPIFHVHGLFVALHCAMLSGCAVTFLPRFSVDAVIEALPGASVMMGVPTHYTRLLDDPRFGAELCADMRLFTSGSAPMTEAVHEIFRQRTGRQILERYGMTETGIISSNPLHGDRVAGSVGNALPEMDLRIATDDGECESGETGIVEVSGPNLFAGYWRLPEKTASEHREDGWFITGDVGSVDNTGCLTLEGRAGDMIISGGENIYPKEIERCLDSAPGVLESAVVGVTDPDFGEAVVAYLVAVTEFDIAVVEAWLEARLARFKHPKRYVVLDELPRNTMGKVQKAELRGRPI
jgi:malonyl-CoA/methylmalonyl-CoA synthetase